MGLVAFGSSAGCCFFDGSTSACFQWHVRQHDGSLHKQNLEALAFCLPRGCPTSFLGRRVPQACMAMSSSPLKPCTKPEPSVALKCTCLAPPTGIGRPGTWGCTAWFRTSNTLWRSLAQHLLGMLCLSEAWQQLVRRRYGRWRDSYFSCLFLHLCSWPCLPSRAAAWISLHHGCQGGRCQGDCHSWHALSCAVTIN